MKKLNKKGFTLIELLAVIVVLAIIMVIATNQINKTIANSRANSFVESYQMIVKQVNLNIASGDPVTCDNNKKCKDLYNLSDDYSLIIYDNEAENQYMIKLGIAYEDKDGNEFKFFDYNDNLGHNTGGSPVAGKKFSNINLLKYGSNKCKKDLFHNTSSISVKNTVKCDADYIIGVVNY